MKLTKFVHACVLVDDGKHVALFDPGEFGWGSGLVKLEEWPKLDYVLITHAHSDHCSEDFIKALLTRFPDVKIYGPEEVVEKVKAWGATQASSSSSDPNIRLVPLEHDSMAPLAPLPMAQNVAIHFKNLVTSPGDSVHLTETCPVLLVPLAGPWGSAIDGVRMVYDLKPKVVMPIHDWMWNDDWRKDMYKRIADNLSTQSIHGLMPVDGQTIAVEV
jgi:L-ascorbate metabolism protein UlaG (beta-lactamase superfamily)